MCRLAIVALLLASQAAAQLPKRKPVPKKAAEPEPPIVFLVESITVEGSQLYPAERIIPISGLKIGQPGDPKLFEEARDRLIASGAFASVGYRYAPSASGRGYAVTFEVSDIEQVYPLRFDRIPLPESDLRTFLKQKYPLFGDRIPGTRTMIDRFRQAVDEFLLQRQVPLTVDARLTADRPEDIYLLFHPKGAPPVIAEVDFQGNQVIPTTALQNAIHGVAVGTEFREERFRLLLDSSIRPLYEARGRVRVAFPKLDAAESDGVKGLKVTVEIEEGATYSLGELRVEGTQTLNQELERAANLKPGDLANFDEVKEGQQRVHQALRAMGYVKVASTIEREIDDAKRIVDLTLHVSPGPQYTFGKLFIQGLDINAEHEIKRIWALEPGKPFNADYPDYFIQRLHEDQIFENLSEKTRAVLKPNDSTLTVDVTLVFRAEAPKPKKRQL